jgi:hypothetical protein
MKTNRPTLIKICIVAAVLVAVVLHIRQQKKRKNEGLRFRLRMGSFGRRSRSPAAYGAKARTYRNSANRGSDANKKAEYKKKAEQYEQKARELREKNKERDANRKVNKALCARQERSAGFRSAVDRTPVSC